MKMDKELNTAIAVLLDLRCVLPGKVREISVTCGTPGCKCMREQNPEKHTSRQMSYTHEKKTKTLFVKRTDIAVVQEMNFNYKQLREATTLFGHKTTEMVKEHGLEKTKEIITDTVIKIKHKSLGIKSEFSKEKEASANRDKWKLKAVERKSEIEKLQVRVRDLAKSRSDWKEKAMRPEMRDDWIYILDHSIESGKKQCLLVLGVPLSKFRRNNCRLRHEDMVVLATDIVDRATGESVTESLVRIAAKTGTPVQIVSDGGLNIIKGCEAFIKQLDCENSIIKTYDVTHQAALILKHQLKDDEIWKSFCEKTGETKRFLLHTELGYLAPPKPRDKSRWH